MTAHSGGMCGMACRKGNYPTVYRNMANERAEIPLRWMLGAFFGFGLAAYLLKDILPPFIVAAGLAYIISPIINTMERFLRLPRLPAVMIFYLAVILLSTVFFLQAGPFLVKELTGIKGHAEDIVTHSVHDLFGGKRITILGWTLDAEEVSRQLMNKLQVSVRSSGGISRIADVAVKSVFDLILGIVILFYFLYDGKRLIRGALHLFSEQKRDHIKYLAGEFDSILGRFLRGILIIVIFTAAVTWAVLKLYFHLPYAAPLALAIGLLELIPVVGPITSGFITSLAAYSYGGLWIAARMILFYALLRLVIDQVVGPVVLGKAVALSPVLIIFSFLAGGTLFGFTGLLLAIPVAAAIRIFIEYEKTARLVSDEESGTDRAQD
jgi:predicted PurR-regulated permease PerM